MFVGFEWLDLPSLETILSLCEVKKLLPRPLEAEARAGWLNTITNIEMTSLALQYKFQICMDVIWKEQKIRSSNPWMFEYPWQNFS